MDLKSFWVSCCDVSPSVPDHFLSISILASAPPLWKQPSLTFRLLTSVGKTKARLLQTLRTEAELLLGVETPTLPLPVISFRFTFHFHPRSLLLFFRTFIPSLFSRSTRVFVKLTWCPVGMWICEWFTSSHLGPFLKSFFLWKW